MAEFDPFDTMDMYVCNCSEDENHNYQTSSDLETKFAGDGLMGSLDWLSLENAIEWSTPSQPMRANEQGLFIPTLTDEEVNELFNDDPFPIQQPMVYNGVSYAPNLMDGHFFGQTETTATIPMDYETDFVYQPDECQQAMSEIGGVAVAPPYQVEALNHEKNWTVRDENTGKIRPPFLHEYLRKLLDDPNYAHVASYIDAQKGIFKFHDKDMAARLWQEAKQRNCDSDMTYEKFARAIRHYYDKDIIRRYRAHFTFCFGPNSGFGTTWTAIQNFQ